MHSKLIDTSIFCSTFIFESVTNEAKMIVIKLFFKNPTNLKTSGERKEALCHVQRAKALAWLTGNTWHLGLLSDI